MRSSRAFQYARQLDSQASPVSGWAAVVFLAILCLARFASFSFLSDRAAYRLHFSMSTLPQKLSAAQWPRANYSRILNVIENM
jgi:hypothetical protein